jgi:hypothetical protein
LALIGQGADGVLGATCPAQGQANKWIRGMEASRKIMVLKPSTDSSYLRSLQAWVKGALVFEF